MTGLAILFGVALLLIISILTTLIVWEARRPPRHTAGYAVAKGIACDPGEIGLPFESWSLDRGNDVNQQSAPMVQSSLTPCTRGDKSNTA